MYNVFLEEKRQRDRAASVPEVLSGAALKRREILAQRYHARVETFMRQKQIAGEVDAVNDLADAPKAEFRTRDRSREIGPPSISINPYVPEKQRVEMAAVLCPPSLASQELYRAPKLGSARSENRHLELHPPLRLKCSTEVQRIAETIEQRGATLGGSSMMKPPVLRDINHDKWVQDNDFMPPKRRPDATPIAYVMSSAPYEDPLAHKKSDRVVSHAPRSTSSATAARPQPKSYYCAVNEVSVAPRHVTSMSHSMCDDRSAAAMQLVAARLQSRNCGTPCFPIMTAKLPHVS